EVKIAAPKVPLVANVLAAAVSDPDAIRALLVEQVTGSVRWRESVAYMAGEGVTALVEIGAGKALSGMARRIDKTLECLAVGGPDEAKAAAAAIKG
ncbi:MAG: ACP S-malonyltransferase, partial [Pikeienuella sp.]